MRRAALPSADTDQEVKLAQTATLHRADRSDKRLIGSFIERGTQEQFSELAGLLEKTNVELLREAINDLFKKYRKPTAV